MRRERRSATLERASIALKSLRPMAAPTAASTRSIWLRVTARARAMVRRREPSPSDPASASAKPRACSTTIVELPLLAKLVMATWSSTGRPSRGSSRARDASGTSGAREAMER